MKILLSLVLFGLLAGCAFQEWTPPDRKVNEITLSASIRERLTRQLIEKTATLSEADEEADLVTLATSSTHVDGERFVVRWSGDPVIGYSVDSRSSGDRALVNAEAAKLNVVLAPYGYRLVNDEVSPSIRIHFIPLNSFVTLAAADYGQELFGREAEFRRLSRNLRGIALPKWRKWGRNLHSVLMMIDEDLRGELRSQVILHELVHSLGISGHPKKVGWSIMRKEAIIAGITELSDFDKRLITLVYGNLRPGDDVEALRKAIRLQRPGPAPDTAPPAPAHWGS